MPTYDYICPCGGKTEHIVKYDNRHSKQLCAVCGGKQATLKETTAPAGRVPGTKTPCRG